MNLMSLVFLASILFAGENSMFGKSEFKAPAVKLQALKTSYEKYKGQSVVMTGSVKKVCKMSGCWFELADGSDVVRITMKDYGFTVPKEILNKNVKVSGIMEQKELPAKVVKHYMKDEGLPKSEIDKIDKPQNVFQFVADGVQVL